MALTYVASILLNLAISTLCMLVYFESAFREADTAFAHQQTIQSIRRLLRREILALDHRGASDPKDTSDSMAEGEATALLARLEQAMREGGLDPLWLRIAEVNKQRQEVVQRFRRIREDGGKTDEVVWDIEPFIDLDKLLAEASGAFGQRSQRSMQRAERVRRLVVGILIVNTALGAVLCTAGLWLVRKWVVEPVIRLREATHRISEGESALSIAMPYADELGALGREIEKMAAEIAEMRDRLVDEHRRAAAGEMVTRLEETMRDPLHEIRRLAESSSQRSGNDMEIATCQRRIADTVDRFENWLGELHRAVSPTKPCFQAVRLRDFVGDVLTVLRPTLERSRIEAVAELDPALGQVWIDRMQLEHAVVALMTNAVEASGPGQVVRIEAGGRQGASGSWQLSVADNGTGIPPELRDRIFLPFFTTKRDGNGIGLAMASAIVRLHGGRLSVESEPGRGSRFVACFPGIA